MASNSLQPCTDRCLIDVPSLSLHHAIIVALNQEKHHVGWVQLIGETGYAFFLLQLL